MSKYPEYSVYKDSGVESIGDIPEHWENMKLKFLGEALIGLTYSPSEIVNESSGILVFRSSNVQNSKIDYDDCVYVDKEVQEKLITKIGDILICSRNGSINLVGKNALIDELSAGVTFGAFMTIFRSQNYSFLRYFFNSQNFKNQSGLFSTSTINQLTTGVLNNIVAPIPKSIIEQQQIAAFLDNKTAHLDTLIEKKQQMIGLLNEKRIALITQAVTKGLDLTVPMKDSGVEWLGNVPKHWGVMRISHVSILKSGDAIVSEQIGDTGTYPVYGGNGLRGYFENFNHDGDYILIGRQGALCGNINYGYGKFWASEHAVVVHPTLPLNFKWLGETLRVMNLNQYNVSSAQPGLAIANIVCLKIPFPTVQEQNNIALYIENETTKLDRMINTIQSAIAKLQEYRTALITAAVTGKIDVRTLTPHEG